MPEQSRMRGSQYHYHRPRTVTLTPSDDRGIREALGDAAGGRLELCAGESPGEHYHVDISNQGLQVPDHTSIIGRGRPRIVATDGPQGLFTIRNGHDIEIRGLELDGQGESRRALEVLATEPRGCRDISIVDNHIHDFQPKVGEGERPRIWAIRIGDAAAQYRNRDIRFTDNVVENLRETERDNVLFGFMDGFEIRNNRFHDIARNTFLYYSKHGVVSNNHYRMPTARASMAVIGEDVTIRDEHYKEQTAPLRVLNNDEHEADLQGVTVRDSHFARTGIDINDGGAGQPLADVTVRNCRFRGSPTPHQNQSILVGKSDGGAIRDIDLLGNTVEGAHWSGIAMVDVDHGRVARNEVRDCNVAGGPVPDGIRIVRSSNVTASRNRVYDSRGTRATQTHGIVLRDGTDCSLLFNETWGNVRDGIVEEGETTGTRRQGNVVRRG